MANLRCVLTRITPFIQGNHILAKYQSAYRPNHSIETALLRVQNDILKSMDGGKVVALVLLDLSAAFDTVDHCILINVLKDLGFDGNILKWFVSYLSDREQCVKINDKSSRPSKLIYGVPQGSVLGPVLFSLYTRPLSDIIQKHGLDHHFYADDTQIYIAFKPSQAEAQSAIRKLELH